HSLPKDIVGKTRTSMPNIKTAKNGVRRVTVETDIYKGELSENGFIENFRETGEPALLLHGNRGGGVSYMAHPQDSRAPKSAKELIHSLLHHNNLDLPASVPPGKRLRLISCYATGKHSFAQDLADELQRPVVAYGKNEAVYSYGLERVHKKTFFNGVGVKRWGLIVPAPKKIYYPRGIQMP
ncbi:hypothetical protein ACQRKX_004888, partial [Enterobacter cloacae]